MAGCSWAVASVVSRTSISRAAGNFMASLRGNLYASPAGSASRVLWNRILGQVQSGLRRALLDLDSRGRSLRTSLISRLCDERKMKRSSAPGHLQRVIEPDLQRRALDAPASAIHKQSRIFAGGCSNTSANRGAAPASGHCTADCAHTRTCACPFNLVPFVHASAVDLTFLIGRLHAVLAGHSGYGGDQRNPAVIGFNLIETEQQAGVEAVLHRAHMAFDFLAARNQRAIGSREVLGQLGFEMLALLQPVGIESVFQTHQESCSLRNRVRWDGSIGGLFCCQRQSRERKNKTPKPGRERDHRSNLRISDT